MDLVSTFSEFALKDRQAERATFEAAMVEKLKSPEGGYKMSDLLFDLYCCQRDITFIKTALEHMTYAMQEIVNIQDELDKKTPVKKISKAKKKK